MHLGNQPVRDKGSDEKIIGRCTRDKVAIIPEFYADIEELELHLEYYKGHEYRDISGLIQLMFKLILPKYEEDYIDRRVLN